MLAKPIDAQKGKMRQNSNQRNAITTIKYNN